jgi:hypothetical protein
LRQDGATRATIIEFRSNTSYYDAFSGVLRDVSGSWTASYLFSGIAMLCGSALLLMDPLAVKLQEKRTKRLDANSKEINADL